MMENTEKFHLPYINFLHDLMKKRIEDGKMHFNLWIYLFLVGGGGSSTLSPVPVVLKSHDPTGFSDAQWEPSYTPAVNKPC